MGRRFSNTTSFSDMAPQLKKQGVYFPHVEFPQRTSGRDKNKSSSLQIQVSLPKLLYGTNLFEIDGSELPALCAKLSQCLQRLNIIITEEAVANATVKRVDFCKSITLPPYLGTAKQVIHKLQKFNYKAGSDFTRKEFREGSKECFIKYHSSTQGYVVYDKASELLANGFTEIEKTIARHLQQGNGYGRVIRFELSLQKKQSMDALLRRHIGKQKNFTLKDLLSSKIAVKDILLEAFDRIYSPAHTLLITLAEMDENEISHHLESLDLSFAKKATLAYLANKTAKYGLRATLVEMKTEMSASNYNRYKNDLKEMFQNLDTLGLEKPNLIKFLRDEHVAFQLLTPNKSLCGIVNHC